MWVLGIEPRSSGKAVSSLILYAISAAPIFIIFSCVYISLCVQMLRVNASTLEGQRPEGLDPLELTGSCAMPSMCAGNCASALWKSSVLS